MIEIWFFLAFYLGPGVFLSPEQDIISNYVDSYKTEEMCEEAREEFAELFHGVYEDGHVSVRPDCVHLTLTAEGHEI